MKINIEEIHQMLARRREINSVRLEDIEWYENGVKLSIDKQLIDRYRFIGMTNMDFIATDFYKQNPTCPDKS